MNYNQCPKCRKYIIGDYCCTCGAKIQDLEKSPLDTLKDIFDKFGDK